MGKKEMIKKEKDVNQKISWENSDLNIEEKEKELKQQKKRNLKKGKEKNSDIEKNPLVWNIKNPSMDNWKMIENM